MFPALSKDGTPLVSMMTSTPFFRKRISSKDLIDFNSVISSKIAVFKVSSFSEEKKS